MSQYKFTMIVESPSPQEAIQNILDQIVTISANKFQLEPSPTTTGTVNFMSLEELT